MKLTTAFYTLALSFAAVTGSADARIGQKMSSDAFESRMMSGTQDDCADDCCQNQPCDPSSPTACGAGLPPPVDGGPGCGMVACDDFYSAGKYICDFG